VIGVILTFILTPDGFFGGALIIGVGLMVAGMAAVIGYASAADETMPRRTHGPWRDIDVGGADVLLVVNAGPREPEARDVLRRHGALFFLDETHRDWS
jgi:hypothetical protein